MLIYCYRILSKRVSTKSIIKSFAILVVLGISFPVLGQFEEPSSIEFELEVGFKGEEIFSVGENGFILSATTERETVRHFNEWKFLLFDTSLAHIFSKTSFISDHLKPFSQSATDEFSHACFLGSDGDYLLNTFTVESFDLNTVKGSFPMKGKVISMAPSKKHAWFSYDTKMGWNLISIDWMTGEQRVHPIVINDVKRKNMTIIKIQVLEESQKMLVFIRVNKNRLSSEFYMMKLDTNANFEYLTKLDAYGDESIISITALEIGKDEFACSGTFSNKRVMETSEGLFFLRVKNKKVEGRNFYRYDVLNDFKQVRSQDYKYGYQTAIHDLIPTDSGYIFMAEMYYPRYSLDVNNVPEHIGNTYTHATVCEFDTSGKLGWNNTVILKLNGITSEKDGVIRVLPKNNNKIQFAYAEGNFYVLNEIDLSTHTVSSPEFVMTDNKQSTDGNIWYNANILNWYGKHWLFFSTQTKKVKINGKSRKVGLIFLSKEP